MFVLRILLCRLGPFVRLHSIHYSDFQVQTLARQFSIVILQSEHFFKNNISKIELASSICLLEFLVSANSFLIPSFSSSISLNKGEWMGFKWKDFKSWIWAFRQKTNWRLQLTWADFEAIYTVWIDHPWRILVNPSTILRYI